MTTTYNGVGEVTVTEDDGLVTITTDRYGVQSLTLNAAQSQMFHEAVMAKALKIAKIAEGCSRDIDAIYRAAQSCVARNVLEVRP
jgi:hypothetical protein